jgi:hypothetical protein
MRCASGVLAATLVAWLVAPGTAAGVSLRPSKATDDSVCDLTHDTNAYLTSKVLVPAAADSKDQVETLYRLAAEFIAANCRDGQLLMLQGSAGVSVDAPSLTEVANSACAVASVERMEIKRTVGERAKPGFQLRCQISKHQALVKSLADRERAEPLSAIKARMYSTMEKERTATSSGTAKPLNDKCGEMTLGTILQGGACK